jgi:two-component system chemotaxis response regulator CheB
MLPSASAESRPVSDPVRVLVVDDAAVVRGLLSRWVGEMPGFEVVGTAANGRIALARAAELAPDIVLLDLDMPELDGTAALPMLLRARPGLSVIVVSTLTQHNAELSLACLRLGALDYLPKPATGRDLTLSTGFRQELARKLQGLADRPRHGAVARPPLDVPHRPASLAAPIRPRALVVGASTGGPRAVIELLRGLTAVIDRVPVFIVQHMPAIFTRVFAEQIRHETRLAAWEATDGEAVAAGRIYVAPGGRHMGLAAGDTGPAIRLDDGPPRLHCRPAADVLFADAARVYGAATLGVVLTGMGTDGTEGARTLVQAGGTVLVQDEATCAVWGMPGSVAKAGLARSVLPLGKLAPAVEALVCRRAA